MFPMMGWGGNWDMGWGWGWAAFFGVVIGLLIAIVPWFFFLWNLQSLLERVDPRNRAMPAGHVWLNFIPIFNLGYFIYTVIKIKESLLAEYGLRGWKPEGDQGYNVGIAVGVLAIVSFFLGWVPGLGWAVGLAALICWIIYWLKTHELKNRLGGPATWPYTAHGGYPGGGAGPYGSAGPPPYQQQQPGAQNAAQPGAQTAPVVAPAAPPASQTSAAVPVAAAAAAVAAASDDAPAAAAVAEEPPAKTWASPPVWPSGSAEAAAAASSAAEEQAKQCAACGQEYGAEDKFCRSCGLKLP